MRLTLSLVGLDEGKGGDLVEEATTLAFTFATTGEHSINSASESLEALDADVDEAAIVVAPAPSAVLSSRNLTPSDKKPDLVVWLELCVWWDRPQDGNQRLVQTLELVVLLKKFLWKVVSRLTVCDEHTHWLIWISRKKYRNVCRGVFSLLKWTVHLVFCNLFCGGHALQVFYSPSFSFRGKTAAKEVGCIDF